MLHDDTIENLALIGLVAVAVIAWNVRWAFEAWADRNKPDLDTDEITEAIADQTRDLLDALKTIDENGTSINADTSWIRESVAHLAGERPPYDDRQLLEALKRMDSAEPVDLDKRPDD